MWNIICMGDVYIYLWVETFKLLIISKGITKPHTENSGTLYA